MPTKPDKKTPVTPSAKPKAKKDKSKSGGKGKTGKKHS